MWSIYLQHASTEDKEIVQAWNSDIDSILIFAALFSAVLTTLLVESYQNLQPDPQIELMRAILVQLQRSSGSSVIVQDPVPAFELTGSAIRVNVYWFSSLIISLSTALLGILAKQWVNNLLVGLSPIPSQQTRHRQYRIDGLHKWKLPALLSFLPLLLHVSLLLFFAGLVDFVWAANSGVAAVAAVLVIVTFLFYLGTNILAYIYPDCPFKTSVTIAISLSHELLRIAYAGVSYRANIWFEYCKTIARHAMSSLRSSRATARTSLRAAIREIHQSISVAESSEGEKKRFSSLVHVASLRYQDEKYVAQNASLMDARALTWLVQNSGRFYLTEELGNAIMHFPDLVRHRTMLVQDGVFTFLEDLFKTSCTIPFSDMGDRQRHDVSSVVATLGLLVSEAEVDADDYSEAPPAGTVTDKTPFLRVLCPPYGVKPTLSDGSLGTLSGLASKLDVLPLSLASSVLRLLAHMKPEASNTPPLTPRSGSKAVEDFVQRVLNVKADSKDKNELSHAVKTILFVGLCDVSHRAQRARLLGAPAASPGIASDVQYWLTVLLNILLRHAKVLDGVTRRQVCWGMCVLSWAQASPQANGAVVKPLLPRLNSSHLLTTPLIDLLSVDQDANILDTVIVTLETVLWDVDPLQPDSEDHADICRALQSSFGPFLIDFYKGVMTGVYPSHRLAKLVIPLARISTYLSFFDRAAPVDAKVSLTATTLSILKYLVVRLEPVPATSGKVPKPRSATALDLATRRWIYRAACRIAISYLMNDTSELPIATAVPSAASTLIFTRNTDAEIAQDFTDALERISSVRSSNDPTAAVDKAKSLQPYTLETFCWILRDAFTQTSASITTRSPVADAHPLQLVVHLIGTNDVLRIALGAGDPCIQVNVLVPAIECIYKAFYPDSRPTGELPKLRSPNDNAGQIARALRTTFVPFLRMLTEKLLGATLRGRELHELLVSVVGIAGYLAFYDRPGELPTDDFLDAMLAYLHALVEVRASTDSSQLWRHAWGALGSMATLYLCDRSQLESDRAPLLRFRFDKADPTRMAARLLRIFDIGYAALHGEQAKYHCAACALPPSTALADLDAMPVALAESALGMILHMWDVPDPEAGEVQRQLIAHGLASRIEFLAAIPADIGWMAKKLLSLVRESAERTASSEKPRPTRRLTL
ncbi:hypothetical protein C8Q70DRAFT_143219 [Cubamyces menziesii]|nr:hypothetical protein C8Q70DRAFT_143219 [Cubamyces menziesii]